MVANQHTHRLASLDHPLHPQPRRRRQSVKRFDGCLAKVECHEPEIPGAEHKCQRLDRLIDRAIVALTPPLVRREPATDPQQALEIDRELSSKDPASVQARLDLSFSEGKFGFVLAKLGRTADALTILRKGVQSQESLLVKDRHNDLLRGYLAGRPADQPDPDAPTG